MLNRFSTFCPWQHQGEQKLTFFEDTLKISIVFAFNDEQVFSVVAFVFVPSKL